MDLYLAPKEVRLDRPITGSLPMSVHVDSRSAVRVEPPSGAGLQNKLWKRVEGKLSAQVSFELCDFTVMLSALGDSPLFRQWLYFLVRLVEAASPPNHVTGVVSTVRSRDL